MKKMLFAAAAMLCGSLFAAAPVPVLEFKLDDPDLAKAVNTGSQQPGMKIKAHSAERFGAGEGRKGNKVLAFNNLTEKQLPNKIAGLEIPQTAYKMDFSKPFTFMAFVKINDKLNNKGPQYTIAGTVTSSVGPGWRLFYSWFSFRFFAAAGKDTPKEQIKDIHQVDLIRILNFCLLIFLYLTITATNSSFKVTITERDVILIIFRGKLLQCFRISIFSSRQLILTIFLT